MKLVSFIEKFNLHVKIYIFTDKILLRMCYSEFLQNFIQDMIKFVYNINI